MTSFDQERLRMVSEQIERRGVKDAHVIRAFGTVRREAFVPERWRFLSYADTPLPIGEGQTISQPYVVAYMVESLALEGGEKVLEIGAGSGYAAAILAEIADEVFAIERIERLAEMAKTNLSNEGHNNVQVRHSNGARGWIEHAPYDAILVSAGASKIPEALKEQLVIGGRLVIPVDSKHQTQELVRVTRIEENEFKREYLAQVQFVPLVD